MRPDRIEKDESILVDIITCNDNPDLQDTHLSGRTVDISEAGMKVSMRISVPQSTVLGLRLDLDEKVFRLEGDVRWSQDDGEVFVGVKLSPDSPDYEQWMKLFDLQFDEPGAAASDEETDAE